ncbi:hypothetical protein [Streptomyces sp. NPDC018000]|uniref:hypothetical protein n=1 Tax=Streptomyces sp. NPDC018000 TaxID=3365028 RepID=UPI0037B351C8
MTSLADAIRRRYAQQAAKPKSPPSPLAAAVARDLTTPLANSAASVTSAFMTRCGREGRRVPPPQRLVD